MGAARFGGRTEGGGVAALDVGGSPMRTAGGQAAVVWVGSRMSRMAERREMTETRDKKGESKKKPIGA